MKKANFNKECVATVEEVSMFNEELLNTLIELYPNKEQWKFKKAYNVAKHNVVNK